MQARLTAGSRHNHLALYDPASIRDRGSLVLAGARLSAPGGALFADRLEFMTRPGETRKHSDPEVVAVPAGDSEVEVREL
jgi:hypothetical protein